MKTWIKVVIITLILGIPAFLLDTVLWPRSPDIAPTAAQLPFFIALSAVEGLLFGLGVAYLIFAWPLVRGKGAKTMWAYLAAGWLLVSWWPHDNFHASNGVNPAGLLRIEYGFHVTLIIASLILAHYLVGVWRKRA